MNDISKKVLSDDSADETANHYDDFFGPLYFEPYAIEVAKRIGPADVAMVLEIAAGTGRVTRHLRERISPTAKLIASDISEDMLAIAKKKLNHLDIDWQIIDAEHLPFSDYSIDMVVCCFGYMFVADKPKAFAEAHRVLKPGGRLLFTTWDKLENNAPSFTARSIAEKYLDKPLPESYDVATSMNDEALIKPLLKNAGFSTMSIEKVKLLSGCRTAKEAADGLTKGELYEEIARWNAAWIDEIKAKVEKELAEKFGDAPMVAPISALISEARK